MATKQVKQVKLEDPIALRHRMGKNQKSFWHQFGVTQSGGSRFESGRKLSKPLRMLFALSTGKASIDDLYSGRLADMV